MKPPLDPSSMFIILVIFFISINIPTSLGVEDDRFENCVNAFSCGNISNLKYPFWGENRAEYCGLPDFHLECEANIPKIIIQSIKYRVLDLNSNSQSLTLVRDDYLNTLCPSEYKNNSFDPNTFKYGDGVIDVTLLYDCDDYFPKNQYVGQSCKRNNGISTYVYYVRGLVYISYCKNSVIMPVFQYLVVTPDQIPSAIDYGFRLQWMGRAPGNFMFTRVFFFFNSSMRCRNPSSTSSSVGFSIGLVNWVIMELTCHNPVD
ncbi:LEAF RUST 10 DISEASE-RESISTANCE LOCUS RECEPTOR-LIKE PROTEIN KINASE-like 2.1 [Senna tora]|uniref:LEAF RUST 10 DISEASE-RESISTANCE LOCUS RECEPTOR-LIKE PROTEIN KINASE-like 2.1 n=1 Tax=Senna tora TaxID=362788 RepID=A0A834SXA2_9FABA|nr:LEAF RUST 10 DISEASE-RESISTANCE LOCUS RECEPTOR-LIKE PROTEIN KINASE-like 2.1 [Senna tora]